VADWWQAFQPTIEDPKQTVVILTRLRGEADQFNLACQQLREQAGQLGAERLQVRAGRRSGTPPTCSATTATATASPTPTGRSARIPRQDMEQRRAHRACQDAIERVQVKQRAERERTDPADSSERDPQQPAEQAFRTRLPERDRAGRDGRERDAG